MKKITSFLLAFFLMFTCLGAYAQPGKAIKKNGEITKVARFKPPVVNAFLGRNKDTMTVTVDEAMQLIGLPIRVTDAKNKTYQVTSFGFAYKRKGVVENEQSGKKEVKYTTVADVFTKTPLPDVWKNNITRTLQKDEEFFFYDILVKDEQNRGFFAPQILIKIK